MILQFFNFDLEKEREKDITCWLLILVSKFSQSGPKKKKKIEPTRFIAILNFNFLLSFFLCILIHLQELLSGMSALRSVQVLRMARVAAAPRLVVAPCVAHIHIGRAATTCTLRSQKSPLSAILSQTRRYAASSGLSEQEIQNRIIEVLRSFEKVDPAKVSDIDEACQREEPGIGSRSIYWYLLQLFQQVSNSSSFTKDLGLDSLDAVEVVMAIEEEFSIEILDAEADNITTVQEAIEYIAKTPEGGLASLILEWRRVSFAMRRLTNMT